MRKPVVGLTGRRMSASAAGLGGTGLGHQDIDMYFSDYAQSIAGSGGIPVQLTRDADPVDLVALLDALVLSGGADIEPSRYGEEPDPKLGATDPDRDEFELALWKAARERDIPILAICRGAQLMNVAEGGSLRQHLDLAEGDGHPNWGAPGNTISHEVSCEEGSLIASLIGLRRGVNSLHHQVVEKAGRNIVVSARASDGVAEAFEIPGAPVLGVQWHPEMLGGPDPTFHWLIGAARDKMAR